MTTETLNKIFQEAHKELISELTPEKINELFKQSLKNADKPSTEEIIAVVSAKMFTLNQRFLFKVLEKVLVDKN